MNDPDNSKEKDKEKVVRMVDYLLKLANLRTRLVHDIGDYEKVLWISSIPRERGCFTQAWGNDEDRDTDEWLEIQSQPEPKLPSVPDSCEEWVNKSVLRNKSDTPKLRSEIVQEVPNPNWMEGCDFPETLSRTKHLKDHDEIQSLWESYIKDRWLPWKENHDVWEKVHRVYSDLFAIYQEQLRLGEEYELVLGLGLLTWKTPSGHRVRRHLIVADVSLDFEARLGKFTVGPNSEGPKLRPELDMLDIGDQPQGAEKAAKDSLINADDDPWCRDCVEGVLKALAHSIGSQGCYDESLESKPKDSLKGPVVEYAPALFLRKRSVKGLTDALTQIKSQIEDNQAIPSGFADLAEIRLDDVLEPGDESENTSFDLDHEVFFPKPANDEQIRIVEKVRTGKCVLVQGPPGTGKSHTIANLICHLLATGQRTLITAKTPRALQVLQRLVPDELRPLCISVLGRGIEEHRALESSVNTILREAEKWNDVHAFREIEDLKSQLRKLREEKASNDRNLLDIRQFETRINRFGDGSYQGTAARIVDAVNRDRERYGWFTDSVPLDEPCKLCSHDLRVVIDALRKFTPEKRLELTQIWPENSESQHCFVEMIRNENSAIEQESRMAVGADERTAGLLAGSNSQDIETIREAFRLFGDTLRHLRESPYSWLKDSVRDVLGGNLSIWHELHRVTSVVVKSIEDLVRGADDTKVEIPDSLDIRRAYEDCLILKRHVETKGDLGGWLYRPKVVRERMYLVEKATIDGRPCRSAKDFSTLSNALFVRIKCEEAWNNWIGRAEKIDGPYVLQIAELKSIIDALGKVLGLEQLVSKCQLSLTLCSGLGEPVWIDESQVDRIVASCNLALARVTKKTASEKILQLEDSISHLAAKSRAHQVTKDLLSAIRDRDEGGFVTCLNKIQELNEQRQQNADADKQLSELRHLVPELKKSLERSFEDASWDERVECIVEAWYWGQARCWVEKHIGKDNLAALTICAKQIDERINSIVTKCAAVLAWKYCFSRLKDGHRRHMEAWKQSMRRLGKGTGKFAPHHRRDAQGHLNQCREAVPAWVMPLHRVWDTVTPSPETFDVIIVDEASQCGFEALPLLYLAKKILIVGDDKQISPDAVGLPREAVLRLKEEYLDDFEFKSSFDVESSLFDHGKLRHGSSRITLVEHFRCMPEIIRFSNDLCYSDTPLIPLRQYGRDRLPPLKSVFVEKGYREGEGVRAINPPEADAIVEMISKMCQDPRYDDKTMGVVVLQGEAQASLIETQLLKQIGAEEMDKRRLVCGNPYSFQGDERDIIFLSLVAASNHRIGPLTKAADQRRFNVAASRARDMMVLFHSVRSDELSSSCLRRQLIEHFEDKKIKQIGGISQDELQKLALREDRKLVNAPNPFDSWFEVDVALVLLGKGFRVVPQYEVAGKRIDLVVDGGQGRLAIECDGDYWHGPEQYEKDMLRQRQLERCGWEFYRVRESAFYSNKEGALEGLWGKLEERSIFPESKSREYHTETDSDDRTQGSINDDMIEDEFEEEDDLVQPTDDSDDGVFISTRRPEVVSEKEIRSAIISALRKCPNYSCTQKSVTSRVLKEVGVRTRGDPRTRFDKRVMRVIKDLESMNMVELYRAKNKRVRLSVSS